jgi:HAE1 family hydrophobic/amphiphilic exporter-1
VLTQQVALGDVYQTLQTFMGGALVNYFTRFGRQWQVYVQAEGSYRTSASNLGKFYVTNAGGALVPLEHAHGSREPQRPGVRDAIQPVSGGSNQRGRRAWL